MKGAKENPRIRIVDGQLYAFAGRGNRKSANLLLVPAISFCKRMNESKKVRT